MLAVSSQAADAPCLLTFTPDHSRRGAPRGQRGSRCEPRRLLEDRPDLLGAVGAAAAALSERVTMPSLDLAANYFLWAPQRLCEKGDPA